MIVKHALNKVPVKSFWIITLAGFGDLLRWGNANAVLYYVNQRLLMRLVGNTRYPDKYSLVVKAYPDPDIKKVVERQWEFSCVWRKRKLSKPSEVIDVISP